MYDSHGLAWTWTEPEDRTVVLDVSAASRVNTAEHRSRVLCKAHATAEALRPGRRDAVRVQEFQVKRCCSSARLQRRLGVSAAVLDINGWCRVWLAGRGDAGAGFAGETLR
eukprot:2316574-Rhodomonas_salina.1